MLSCTYFHWENLKLLIVKTIKGSLKTDRETEKDLFLMGPSEVVDMIDQVLAFNSGLQGARVDQKHWSVWSVSDKTLECICHVCLCCTAGLKLVLTVQYPNYRSDSTSTSSEFHSDKHLSLSSPRLSWIILFLFLFSFFLRMTRWCLREKQEQVRRGIYAPLHLPCQRLRPSVFQPELSNLNALWFNIYPFVCIRLLMLCLSCWFSLSSVFPCRLVFLYFHFSKSVFFLSFFPRSSLICEFLAIHSWTFAIPSATCF